MKNRSFHRLLVGSTALCMALLSTCVLFAQPGGRGGRGGGGGAQWGFGGGRGGFGMQGGDFGSLQLMGLLRTEEVRNEIDLDDEVWEALSERQLDLGSLRDMGEDERKKAVSEANDTAQEMMEEVLEPSQQKRLMGLLAQQLGAAAALNKMIAEEIGLDEDGIKKLREGLESVNEEMGEKRREMFSSMFGGRGGRGGRPGEGDEEGGRPDASARDEMMKKFGELQKETQEMSNKKFEQIDKKAFGKLEELKGEKFEFPQRQFGRGGAGGRGQGGAGGRGGRGGGEGGGRGGRGGGNDA